MWDKLRDKTRARRAEIAGMDLAKLERAATESTDPNFLIEVGDLYHERNQTEDALRLMDKAKAASPDAFDADMRKAGVCYRSGGEAQAAAIWETIARSGGEYDRLCAQIYLAGHRKKYRDAIALYERLEEYEDVSPRHFADVLLTCYIHSREFQKVKDLCATMLRVAPDVAYLQGLAIAEEGLRNFDVAEQLYAAVLDFDPADTTTVGLLCRLHTRRLRFRSGWRVFWDGVKAHVDKPVEIREGDA